MAVLERRAAVLLITITGNWNIMLYLLRTIANLYIECVLAAVASDWSYVQLTENGTALGTHSGHQNIRSQF